MEKDILYLASWMSSNNVAGYHISWAFVETEGTASRLRQAGSEQNGNCLLISISVLNFEALDLGAKSSPPRHHVIFNYVLFKLQNKIEILILHMIQKYL